MPVLVRPVILSLLVEKQLKGKPFEQDPELTGAKWPVSSLSCLVLTLTLTHTLDRVARNGKSAIPKADTVEDKRSSELQ